MKKLFLLILNLALFATAVSFAQSNAIDKLFTDKTTNEDFNYVSISANMLSSISKSNENNAEIKEIIASLKGLKVLKTEKNPLEFYNSARLKIGLGGYEELMSVKEKGSNVIFFSTGSQGNIVKELILLVGNKQNAVLMSFTGNINIDKISKIGKAFNIEGADKLDKLQNR
ncbi:MAG: DUF4252 domain-containing protein [Saprospiraceae bacterium]|nr:DUF4252 domain-containing protein [Saprospiraceae bacterium]